MVVRHPVSLSADQERSRLARSSGFLFALPHAPSPPQPPSASAKRDGFAVVLVILVGVCSGYPPLPGRSTLHQKPPSLHIRHLL